jgi:GNAT superfamily N-acetyltransferase
VLPTWQGQGIAKRLICAIVAQAQRKHALLLLCRRDRIGLYERLEFVSRGPSASSHGRFDRYQMQMQFPL